VEERASPGSNTISQQESLFLEQPAVGVSETPLWLLCSLSLPPLPTLGPAPGVKQMLKVREPKSAPNLGNTLLLPGVSRIGSQRPGPGPPGLQVGSCGG
jgi:hypothetical protein